MADNTTKEHSHAGHRLRLKQRFLEEGLEKFQQHEILELLLFYTIPQRNTNEIAHDLIKTFGSLSRVFDAHPSELQKVKGISEHSSILISMMPQLARTYLKDLTKERSILNSTSVAGNYVHNLFISKLYESFCIICMDKSCRVIHTETVYEGTLDETPCYPRLALEIAFRHHAQKVIFAHNHPSDILRPSPADIESTKKLVSIFESIDIEVVDHIITGKSSYYSMAANGCLK